MKKLVFLFVSIVVNCQMSNAQWTAGTPTGVYYLNSGNAGIGTAIPADKLEVVTGNRKVGFNTIIPNVSQGGALSISRLSDGGKHMFFGPSAAPNEDAVIYADGGSSEMRLVSGGLSSGGFGFYTNISTTTAFGNTRPTPLFKIDGSGNVGVGTSTPNSKFEIGVNLPTQGIYETQNWNSGNSAYNLRLQTAWDNNGINYHFIQRYAGTEYNSLSFYYGRVGIGTRVPDAALTVKGTIHTQEVKVDLSVPGPDYVFETCYKLPSLDELNTYIKLNKHLPEVPSACSMEENGIKLGEMNMLLLKKVEELTLYVIEQQKEMKVLKAKINLLEAK